MMHRTLRLVALATLVFGMAAAHAGARSKPRTVLFVGNSFTQGAHSAVKRFQADRVRDLNGDGYGGVPALFLAFTRQAGLDYAVSLETQGGKTLGFHLSERSARIDKAWDVVVLQELSTLDRAKPGDATNYRHDAPALADLFVRHNGQVDVRLMATWSRADQTYLPEGHWHGQPITAMATELRAAADEVCQSTPKIHGVIPVGEAWNRAMAQGVADPNPYDGIAFGTVDLWTYDHYHASIEGYYLEALTVFGSITGRDPRMFGAKEQAADDLGIAPDVAVALQAIAYETLTASSLQCHAGAAVQGG